MRTEWEIEIIHEPSGEYMTVYFGDETFDDDDEPMTHMQVIEAVLANLSIVPRLIGE